MEESAGRELKLVRTVDAPLNLIWEVWTEPEHLKNWWGPKGFSCTVKKMDFQEGGEWLLTLHGPDGTDFANRSIFKEIVPFEKIVFEHFNPHFTTTVFFVPQSYGVNVEWTLLFDTAEMREIIVKTHGAEEGQKENMAKFEGYVSLHK